MRKKFFASIFFGAVIWGTISFLSINSRAEEMADQCFQISAIASKTITESIDADRITEFALINPMGNITLTGGAATDAVEIQAIVDVMALNQEKAQMILDGLDLQVTIWNESLKILIRPDYSGWPEFGTLSPLRMMYTVDYTISLPAGINEKIMLIMGGGNIDASNVEGDIYINTGSGEVRALDIAGRGLFYVGSGSLEVTGAFDSLNAYVSAGDLNAGITLNEDAGILIKCGFGNISLGIPESTSATFLAATHLGNVEIKESLPVTYETLTRFIKKGSIGSGESGNIMLMSFFGDIEIKPLVQE